MKTFKKIEPQLSLLEERSRRIRKEIALQNDYIDKLEINIVETKRKKKKLTEQYAQLYSEMNDLIKSIPTALFKECKMIIPDETEKD